MVVCCPSLGTTPTLSAFYTSSFDLLELLAAVWLLHKSLFHYCDGAHSGDYCYNTRLLRQRQQKYTDE